MSDIGANIVSKALSHIGEREIGNTNTGPEVDKYLAYVGLAPGQPWCASAASYWVGKTLESMGLAVAFKSGSSSAWYNWGKANNHLCAPRPGVLAVEKGGPTGHKHTLIVVGVGGDNVVCCSGNDQNAVRVDVRDISTMDYVQPW